VTLFEWPVQDLAHGRYPRPVDDFDALEAAGIANARERAGVIKYLDSLGFTVEEMVEAEARGRLFGLAGDVLVWSGPPKYSRRTAAEALGVPIDDVAHAWAVLGLTVADLDETALSQADVDGLSGWFQMKVLMGDDGAFGFLRVLGSTMARLAEAESTVIRAGTPDIQMDHTHDELATAQAFRWVAEYVPRISVLVDAVHRQHLVSARTHFEGVLRDTSANVVCGVGFADLSGFTALTQTLSLAELSMLLNEFIAGVSDVVHADGGRVVKFIGDEVMWVSSTPELLAKAAVDLVNHPKAREEGIHVRAGLCYGGVLAINGDYFGNVVNLAARLVGAAKPGQILVSQAVRDELPEWAATVQDALTLKGFDAPVTAYELHGNGDR
jgi:class 3 adenylate cyclase